MGTMLFIKHLFRSLSVALLIISWQDVQGKQGPYNVLFITVDDLRTELNCYGASHIKSPNIDRLAEVSVRFTNAYVQQAICMASRASVLSGIRPENRGIYTGESLSDLMPDVVTINKFFEQNGYSIASSGKIYHFGEDTEKQFGEDYMVPNKTWEGLGYVTEESIRQQELNTRTGRGPAYESANVHDTIYQDGINTLNAIRKLEELEKSEQPFFMAVGLTKPHLPFVAPQKYWDLYPEASISPAKLREKPENSSKYTMRVAGELGNYAGMPQEYSDVDETTELILRRGYYAAVSYADAQVGKLLDQLDALGLRDNTIVVLWGDHGFKLGDYGAWCKWSNMHIDTNIPLLISVPTSKKGIVMDQMVEALDIYPTLAELCGLKPPTHLEGKSLAPLLNNPSLESETHRYAYTIWPHDRWDYDKTVMGYSVKDDRFNYVEWVQLKSGEVLETELYDHSVDPQETSNVIGNPKYEVVIAQLSKECIKLKAGTDHNHTFKKLR